LLRLAAAPIVDLEQLKAQHCTVLKDEPAARVEILGLGERAVVRKTYRNVGLRLLQTFLRRSRAAREFDNLRAVAGAGVACTPPILFVERRRCGFVSSSTLVSGLVRDAVSLKATLAAMPASATDSPRAALCAALGRLLAQLHAAGVLWCTPMPRNVLVAGSPSAARLVLCDAPAAVRFRGPVPAAAALLDLYDAVASPSRRRELSRTERWRCLCAYSGWDRDAAGALWRRLRRRSRTGHRLRKNLLMAVRTYILRRHPVVAAASPEEPGHRDSSHRDSSHRDSSHSDSSHRDSSQMSQIHAPMQPSKLQNYNSGRGALAYKADYQNKLHRKLSDRRERALLLRYLAVVGPVDSILDLPCGHGRLSNLLHQHCRRLIEADWSFTMVDLNQQDHGGDARNYLRCSALQIPLPDRSVDAVVSFRLSHHLETQELREVHMRELFRVARRAVIVTWFSATSLKNWLRQLRVALGAKRPKNVMHGARVRAIAVDSGFVQHAARPLFLVGSGHALGLFTRRSEA
jgi:tRNA A-37 threonylcarbamoyl transferase component Bud32/SAM-dependent methyltransferase